MAEPPEQTALPPAAGGLPGLLATKLNLPRLRSGFVPRPRLVDLLDEGLARDLILVCAPAGFGKTALLTDWSQRRERLVAWLSLDAGDNDPVRFWRHVMAALDRALPGVFDRGGSLLGAPEPTSFTGLATALVNELAAQPDEVLLVLDDYHLVDAEPVHTSLSFLLEHLPPVLHVVLASRVDPPLPLARLRADGHLTEVRAAELRFTAEEAAALLRAAVGSDLDADAVSLLTARTEGWAAGLQLASLSVKGRSDFVRLVETFSGSHRYVLDYLTEEVLECQREQVREFLVETSILERLSGPLCNAVTERTDSQQMLEAIEHANLFLVPLDEQRCWWRYHHLFADLLRARLHQRRPEQVADLHRNAAAWSQEHGLVDDAVRHALAAGEELWAARLVERYFDALVLGSEGATVRRWLALLPPELVSSRPRLLLAQAWLARFGGDMEQVEELLDAADGAAAQAADEPYEPSVGPAASWLANVPAAIASVRAYVANLRGEPEATVAFASRAMDGLGDDELMLDTATHVHLAVGEWLRGRLGEAERHLDSNITKSRAADQHDLAAWSSHYLGQVQRAQGRLDAALGTYQRALEVDARHDRPPLPAAGVAYVGLSEVAYERDELDAARRHLTEGLPLCRQFVYTKSLAAGLATLAWIQQARGDTAAALDSMGEAEQATGPAVADLVNPVPAARARLLLAQGDVAAAEQWTDEHDVSADNEPGYPREPAYLVLARVLLAQDQPVQALGLLDQLYEVAAAQDRIGSVIEIQALRALAIAATGDEPEAVAALVEALSLAQPEGYIRVFADEGPPMWSLLGQVIATQRGDQATIALGYLGRLARAVEHSAAARQPGTRPGPSLVSGLVAQLSERELEVLRLVAAGRPNQQIADELFVALSTVKKHVTHIFEKLGAANRTEATARARELGLIP